MNRALKPTTDGIWIVTFTWTLLLSFVAIAQAQSEKDNWAQWRGPLQTGEAPHADPPTQWSEQENVKWKTPIPGRGLSTPIVWNDLVFLTTAVPFGEKLDPKFSGREGAHDNLPVSQHHRFLVMAVNRKDGSVAWQTKVHEELPLEGAHNTASLVSGSPVTDGQHVYAYLGSYGLYCLDFAGKIVWQKQLGKMHTKHGHGEGASPALYGDTLIVNWDHEGASFIATFDTKTGDEKWRKSRDEVTSWSSPITVEHDGGVQVIVAGTSRVRAYDLADGSVIWECGGLSNNVVATPVAAAGHVVAGSSYETRAMFSVQLDGATGDVTGTDQVRWFTRERTPYVPSPLLYKNAVYFLRHYQNIVSRRDLVTGQEQAGPWRLPGLGNIYASPVAAQDRIYFTDMEGVTVVFSHVTDPTTEPPRFVSANKLDDAVSASLALVGKQIFVRGEKFLYCIEEETPIP